MTCCLCLLARVSFDCSSWSFLSSFHHFSISILIFSLFAFVCLLCFISLVILKSSSIIHINPRNWYGLCAGCGYVTTESGLFHCRKSMRCKHTVWSLFLCLSSCICLFYHFIFLNLTMPASDAAFLSLLLSISLSCFFATLFLESQYETKLMLGDIVFFHLFGAVRLFYFSLSVCISFSIFIW